MRGIYFSVPQEFMDDILPLSLAYKYFGETRGDLAIVTWNDLKNLQSNKTAFGDVVAKTHIATGTPVQLFEFHNVSWTNKEFMGLLQFITSKQTTSSDLISLKATLADIDAIMPVVFKRLWMPFEAELEPTLTWQQLRDRSESSSEEYESYYGEFVDNADGSVDIVIPNFIDLIVTFLKMQFDAPGLLHIYSTPEEVKLYLS